MIDPVTYTLVTARHDGYDQRDPGDPDANANGKASSAGVYPWFIKEELEGHEEVIDRAFAPDDHQAEERAADIARADASLVLVDDLEIPDDLPFESIAAVVKALVWYGYIEPDDAHAALAAASTLLIKFGPDSTIPLSDMSTTLRLEILEMS